MTTNLEGKVALVTGAARRIGKAIALALAGEGMDVLVHYGGSADEAENTVGEISAIGVRAYKAQANLARPEDIEQLIATVKRHFGRLDVLVNSASTFDNKKFDDVTLDDWEHVMAINLRAPFYLGQLGARLMTGTGGGTIVNIADLTSKRPRRTFPVHSISKAGLVTLTQVMALSLGPDIRVNAIAPGAILPPTTLDDERWEQLGSGLPLQRTGDPQNVQNAVLFLVKDDFVNGHVLVVDGGELLLGPFGY